RSRLRPAALVSVSLGDPRANGVAAWLKLAGKIVRITSSTDEVDHLSAKLRRIRWTCSWHRQHLRRETQGVHQTGSIPMWLDCPVEETHDRGGKTRTTEARDKRRGIPQGSPLSPLLANIYMRRFVLGWKKLSLE